MSESVANDTIIKNLENQLERLIQQSTDLEDCKYVYNINVTIAYKSRILIISRLISFQFYIDC